MWGHKMTVGAFVTSLIFLGSLLYLFFAFRAPDEWYDFQTGERVLKQMMGERTLQTGGFFEAYPEGGPSDFVNYVNTEEGAIMWPMTRREYHSISSLDQAHASHHHKPIKGRFLRPDDVEFQPHELNPAGGRQLVYIPFDDRGIIEVRAYESPQSEPLFVSHLPFPSEHPGIELR
ncbi:MAG: hypothetical protein ACNA8W_08575 [Bradymonadaceae bacterium]